MLVIIYGPSGSGKSELMRRLAQLTGMRVLPTVTTRPRRSHNEDRTTVSDDEFDRLVQNGEVHPTTPAYGSRYGLQAASLAFALRTVEPTYLVDFSLDNHADIEALEGFKTCFLLLPPSRDELADRLRAQGRDHREEAAVAEYTDALERFKSGSLRHIVNHLVINDALDLAAAEVTALVADDAKRLQAQNPQLARAEQVSPHGLMTDTVIREHLHNGALLEPGTWAEPLIRHASYSVRLGSEAHVYRAATLASSGTRTAEVVRLREGQQLELRPGDSALVFTVESFQMPADVQGLLFPRGLFVASGLVVGASYIDPGFSGRYCFPIANSTNRVIRLPLGLEIARVLFLGLGQGVARPFSSADATSLSVELETFNTFRPFSDRECATAPTRTLLSRIAAGEAAGLEIVELHRRARSAFIVGAVVLMLWAVAIVEVVQKDVPGRLGKQLNGWGSFTGSVTASILAAALWAATSWLLRLIRRRRTRTTDATTS